MLLILAVTFTSYGRSRSDADTAFQKADPSTARWSLSTNAVDWLWLCTFNAEAQYSLSRHLTFDAQVKWNPFEWGRPGGREFRWKQNAVSTGVRWWPWYGYSGWWIGGRGQWREYSRGGFRTPETEEGDAFGAAFSGGYTLLLGPHFNLDFGLGFWTGGKKYRVYACPTCGRTLESGTKFFFLPDEVSVSAMFVF